MEHESQPISSVDRLNLIRSIKKAGGKTSEWREELCEFFDESPIEATPRAKARGFGPAVADSLFGFEYSVG